jgi:hypothetical protein
MIENRDTGTEGARPISFALEDTSNQLIGVGAGTSEGGLSRCF